MTDLTERPTVQEVAGPPRPATLTACLHARGQVAVTDLSGCHGGDLVSLKFGDDNNVAVLGTLDEITKILAKAMVAVAAVSIERAAADQ